MKTLFAGHQFACKKPYGILDSAKAAAFRAIESGDLVEYMIRMGIRFAEPRDKIQRKKKDTMMKLV